MNVKSCNKKEFAYRKMKLWNIEIHYIEIHLCIFIHSEY